MADWSPSSWQQKRADQQPDYPDPLAVEQVVAAIAKLPPLVTSWEVEKLRDHMAQAARGDAFVLQGGDCAESFDACDSDAIAAKLKILLQMSLVLVHATNKPVVRIGRIAGQYAKPRSSDQETRGEVTLPSYRGDLINGVEFTPEQRIPDPELLLRGYERSALTLNFIRALADGGFADLHHTEYWDLGFAEKSDSFKDYEAMVQSIRDSLIFMEAIGGVHLNDMQRVTFYTSHEGLALQYEQAQTRQVPRRDGWYNLATHLPWIGMRTAQPDSAHVEYFRGIRNPVAVKIGPGMTAQWLTELIDVLHPDDEPGRLTLIHRLGAGKVSELLPPLIDTVQATGKTVTWLCDPMHGNTEVTADGTKTRRFDNIQRELEQSFEVHSNHGSRLGGVHIELTGENVTECIGGARGLSADGLKHAYVSRVDPRLNCEQSLEMAMLMARHLRSRG